MTVTAPAPEPVPAVLTAPAPPPAPRRRLSRKAREALLGYVMVLPAFVVFATFVFYPFFQTFRQSFYRSPPFGGDEFYAGGELFEEVVAPVELGAAFLVGLAAAVPVALVLGFLVHWFRRATGRPVTRAATITAFLTIFGCAAALVTVYRYQSAALDGFADRFANSVWVTVVFVLLTVPISLVLGLGLAVLAHKQLRGIGLYRTVFSSTVISSVAVTSVIFFTLLNPVIGLVPYWLGREGQVSLLEDPTWALILVAVASIWQSLGLTFIVMSAGLQAVPDELIEAAEVDGAGGFRRFWGITLPLLSPTLFFALVVGVIFAFQTFGQIDILTRGGPNRRTETLVYLIYQTAIGQSPNRGYAAVMAIALFVVTLSVTALQLRFVERRITYDR